MQRSLTKGPITGSILLFALPLMLGNLLQQMYNIADTWIVGRFLGADALAAVGSSYPLMTFLTSICWACAWAAARPFPCSMAAVSRTGCGRACSFRSSSLRAFRWC